jgi:hypothetical protein
LPKPLKIPIKFLVACSELDLLNRFRQFGVFAEFEGVEMYFTGQQTTIPNN